MTICHTTMTRFAVDSDLRLHYFRDDAAAISLTIPQAEELQALLPDMIVLAKKLQAPLPPKLRILPDALPVPEIGAPFSGGFFAGFDMDDKRYAIVVAPKAEGHFVDVDWKTAIERCAAVRAGGFDDWRAPTKDELYMVYRALGPNVTAASSFKCDQPEAFDERWYWSSTEFDSYGAWRQYFGVGYQFYGGKVFDGRVRAVRKVLI